MTGTEVWHENQSAAKTKQHFPVVDQPVSVDVKSRRQYWGNDAVLDRTLMEPKYEPFA